METLLSKFVHEKINPYEERALSQAEMRNIFGLSSVTNTFFTNEKLLLLFINKLKSLDIREQLNLCQWVLIPIYQMSNDSCKKQILDFIKKSDIENAKNNSDFDLIINYIIVKLLFICLNIENSTEEFKGLIKSTLTKYPKNRFSFILYTLQEMVEKAAEKDESYKELKEYVEDFVKERKKVLPFDKK